MESFDHILIGTGQATGTLLGGLLQKDDVSICVIEGDRVGGSCVNFGCTPTKTLVASARAAHMIRRGPFFGVGDGRTAIDWPRIRERMNEIRNESRQGLVDWLETEDRITFIRAYGRFEAPGRVRAGDRVIAGETIHINVGARPRIPKIEGLESVPWLDNARILDLDRLPEHLVIIGGGYIGLEFGQIFRRFGCKVTILNRSDRIMSREDADVSEAIQEFLEDDGVRVICGAEAASVDEDERGRITVRCTGGQIVTGSHVLVAAGRIPNSDTLNLEAASIETDDRGWIQVDDCCRTTAENTFALGDVNGQGAFTHTSVNDAEIVLDTLGGGPRSLSDRIPVYALFTDPPLGRVGLTETEATRQGYNVLKATKPMSEISRAKEMGETRGFAKLLVDADTDLVLGAAILGPGGDEIINMFAAIMYSGIPCHEYRRAVLVHPTVSELMPFILDNLQPV